MDSYQVDTCRAGGWGQTDLIRLWWKTGQVSRRPGDWWRRGPGLGERRGLGKALAELTWLRLALTKDPDGSEA